MLHVPKIESERRCTARHFPPAAALAAGDHQQQMSLASFCRRAAVEAAETVDAADNFFERAVLSPPLVASFYCYLEHPFYYYIFYYYNTHEYNNT